MSSTSEAAVKTMCQGNIFYIYTRDSKSPVTIFYVPNTPDSLGSIYWCRVGELVRHEQCKFPLNILVDVCIGKQTPSFTRPHAESAPASQCMSLVSDLITLDLEAVHENVINEWVDGLSYILSAYGTKNLVDTNPSSSVPPPRPKSTQARRFTLHGQDHDVKDIIPSDVQANDDDYDDGEAIASQMTSSLIADATMHSAREEGDRAKLEDGMSSIQRGTIAAYYCQNKPAQLVFLCYFRKAEEFLGSLCAIPITSLQSSQRSIEEAQSINSVLTPDARDLLRSLSIGTTIRTPEVIQELTSLTNNTATVSLFGNPFAISLDSMSDLFLGSDHVDFLPYPNSDPGSSLTILNESGTFSIEMINPTTLSLWLTDIQSVLNDSGTDVVAAEDPLTTPVLPSVSNADPSSSQIAPPKPPMTNKARRYTVSRSDLIPIAVDQPSPQPAAVQVVDASSSMSHGVDKKPLQTSPIYLALQDGVDFTLYPNAVPVLLIYDSSTQELMVRTKFKHLTVASVPINAITEITFGNHTPALVSCGDKNAFCLTFSTPAKHLQTPPGIPPNYTFDKEWCLAPLHVEGQYALLSWLNLVAASQNKIILLESLAPRRYLLRDGILSAPPSDRLNVNISSLINMLTVGRVFTGYAERNGGIVMNKLTLFYMSPTELRQILSTDPKQTTDPARAAKLKANIGTVPEDTRGRLCWCSAGRRVPIPDSYIEINDITDIYVGKQTKVLSKNAHQFPIDRCFTIMADGDQLDLVAESSIVLLAWIKALRSLSLNQQTQTGQKLFNKSIVADTDDDRLVKGVYSRRYNVNTFQSQPVVASSSSTNTPVPQQPPQSQPTSPSVTPPPVPTTQKKRLSLLVNDPAAQSSLKSTLTPLTAPVVVDASPEKLLLERGSRFLRYFTSNGKPQVQQVWVYHTSIVDPDPDRVRRSGSLRWLPIAVLASVLGLPTRDPDHRSDSMGPTSYLTKLDHMMAEMPVQAFHQTIREASSKDKTEYFGAWGVLRFAHITDVYTGRTTSSLKILVPQEKSSQCLSIVTRDRAKNQSVLSLRHDDDHVVTMWLRAIEHVIVTGGKAFVDQDAQPPAVPAVNPPSTTDEPSPSSQDAQQRTARGRRFTVTSTSEPDPAGAENKPPNTETRGRRLTVRSNAAPPPIPTAATTAGAAAGTTTAAQGATDPSTSGKTGRRFTVSKDQKSTSSQPIVPEPQQPVLPHVSDAVWETFQANSNVQLLLKGIDVVIYCTVEQDKLAEVVNTQVLPDIGVKLPSSLPDNSSSDHIIAKRCILYYSPVGGKSGSILIHVPPSIENTDYVDEKGECTFTDLYLEQRKDVEADKILNDLSHEALLVHALTDITLGKADPMWKKISTGTPLNPAYPQAASIRNDSCLSLSAKTKHPATGARQTKQLHIVARSKSSVMSIVDALRFMISHSGKKVMYDEQTKKSKASTTQQQGSQQSTAAPEASSQPTPTAPSPQYHDIADLTKGRKFTQYVRAGMSIKTFDVVLSHHKSTQVMFSAYSTNPDPSNSNLGRNHELALAVRSFDLLNNDRGGLPDITPVTASDVKWRGLVESSGLGFFCVKDLAKDSKVWLPLGALTDVYLGQNANAPANARTPESQFTLTFALTGGAAYHLILSCDDEDAGNRWLLTHINGEGESTDTMVGEIASSDSNTSTKTMPPPLPAAVAAIQPPASTVPETDEIVLRMTRNHVMHVYTCVDNQVVRARANVWYEPASHAIMWSPSDSPRSTLYCCPNAVHRDIPTPTTQPPPTRPNCTCTDSCERLLHNVIYLNAINEVFVGKHQSLIKRAIDDGVVPNGGADIDDAACATITAERLDQRSGQYDSVHFNIETNSPTALDDWLSGLQHILTVKGANVVVA